MPAPSNGCFRHKGAVNGTLDQTTAPRFHLEEMHVSLDAKAELGVLRHGQSRLLAMLQQANQSLEMLLQRELPRQQRAGERPEQQQPLVRLSSASGPGNLLCLDDELFLKRHAAQEADKPLDVPPVDVVKGSPLPLRVALPPAATTIGPPLPLRVALPPAATTIGHAGANGDETSLCSSSRAPSTVAANSFVSETTGKGEQRQEQEQDQPPQQLQQQQPQQGEEKVEVEVKDGLQLIAATPRASHQRAARAASPWRAEQFEASSQALGDLNSNMSDTCATTPRGPPTAPTGPRTSSKRQNSSTSSSTSRPVFNGSLKSSETRGSHDDNSILKRICRRNTTVESIQALRESTRDAKLSGLVTAGPKMNALGVFVTSTKFNVAVITAVALNALLVGAVVQYQAKTSGGEHMVFEVAEQICGGFFTIELLLRVVGLQCHLFSREHRWWALIDSVLVAMSWIDIVLSTRHQVGTSVAKTTSVGKTIKVMRMARILRLVHMVRFLTSVRIMVTMIVGSLLALFWLFVLLTIVTYVFSILLTQGAAEWLNEIPVHERDTAYEQVDRFFGSIDRTMYTLFISLTGGISWGEASDAACHFGYAYFCIFCFFMFFSFFSVLNIVTGVFVDGAIQQADKDRALRIIQQEESKKRILEDLRELLFSLDLNGDGLISMEEWCMQIEDPTVKSLLDGLNIQVIDAIQVFELLDVDSDQTVTIAELVEGVHRIKGVAQSLQIHALYTIATRLMDMQRKTALQISDNLKLSRRIQRTLVSDRPVE